MSSLNITARSILILLPPTIQPPFQVRLGIESANPTVKAVGDIMISECQDIDDAVQKTLQVIADLKIEIAADFTLVYPMFVGRNSEEEAGVIDTAWLIKDAADEKGWLFSRILPTPLF